MAKKIAVSVTYKCSGVDCIADDLIGVIAKYFKGKHGGSGFFFHTSTRDVGFIFKSEDEAKAFIGNMKFYLKRIEAKILVD